jgi:hypothetical protein
MSLLVILILEYFLRKIRSMSSSDLADFKSSAFKAEGDSVFELIGKVENSKPFGLFDTDFFYCYLFLLLDLGLDFFLSFSGLQTLELL